MNGKALASMVTIGLATLIVVVGYLWLTVWRRWDATIYARGFSEWKFRQISRGMSKEDVKRILGEPLRNDGEGHVEGLTSSDNRWFYVFLDRAKIPYDDRVTDTWYKVREVDFDEHGRVEKTLRSTEQFE